MAGTSFIASSTGEIMGDADRTAFKFNEDFSTDELLELAERNPRMSLLEWINSSITMSGIEFDDDAEFPMEKQPDKEPLTQSNYLEFIHYWEKQNQVMNYCSWLGKGYMILLGKSPNLAVIDTKYSDCFIAHQVDGRGNGIRIKEVYNEKDGVGIDKLGQPKFFELYLNSGEKDALFSTSKPILINAERVIVWKNPKKRMQWGGTPDSKQISHVAQLEELLMKCIGKRGLRLAGAPTIFKKVRDAAMASKLSEKWNGGNIDALYVNDVEIADYEMKLFGTGTEFKDMVGVLREFIAAGLQVDKEALDKGESKEGGIVTNYAKIKQRQAHFKPYMEQTFRMLGFTNPHFEWNEPITEMVNPNLPVQNRDEMDSTGKRDQSIKSKKEPGEKNGK